MEMLGVTVLTLIVAVAVLPVVAMGPLEETVTELVAEPTGVVPLTFTLTEKVQDAPAVRVAPLRPMLVALLLAVIV